MNSLNILSFTLAVIAYTIHELQAHGKLKWQGKDYTFWGLYSYVLKYKIWPLTGAVSYEHAPPTWYYRFFKIKYKENFPGSATIFVSLTDGPHLMQLFFKLFLILTIVIYEPIFNMVWDFIGYFALWGIVFSLTYKIASK